MVKRCMCAHAHHMLVVPRKNVLTYDDDLPCSLSSRKFGKMALTGEASTELMSDQLTRSPVPLFAVVGANVAMPSRLSTSNVDATCDRFLLSDEAAAVTTGR